MKFMMDNTFTLEFFVEEIHYLLEQIHCINRKASYTSNVYSLAIKDALQKVGFNTKSVVSVFSWRNYDAYFGMSYCKIFISQNANQTACYEALIPEWHYQKINEYAPFNDSLTFYPISPRKKGFLAQLLSKIKKSAFH